MASIRQRAAEAHKVSVLEADDLAALLGLREGGAAERPADLVLLDVGHTAPAVLARAAVVPGARAVALQDLDVCLYDDDHPPAPARPRPRMVYGNFNLKSPQELRNVVEKLGVCMTSTVVVYTQELKEGVADTICAARLIWALVYLGVKDVRLLNGGLRAWTEAGWPVHAQPCTPSAPRDFFLGAEGLQVPLAPHVLATTEDVRRVVAGRVSGVALADVRSWDEYTGAKHWYDFDLGLGRIPGAKFANWGPSTYRGGAYSHADQRGFLCPIAQVRAMWEDWNVINAGADGIIFYCGSGWRSSMAWMMAELMGLRNCKSYDGSFLEWNRLHPDASEHCVERGDPREAAGAQLAQRPSAPACSPPTDTTSCTLTSSCSIR